MYMKQERNAWASKKIVKKRADCSNSLGKLTEVISQFRTCNVIKSVDIGHPLVIIYFSSFITYETYFVIKKIYVWQ